MQFLACLSRLLETSEYQTVYNLNVPELATIIPERISPLLSKQYQDHF